MVKLINYIDKSTKTPTFWLNLLLIASGAWLMSCIILKHYNFNESKLMKNVVKKNKDVYAITFLSLYVIVVYKFQVGFNFKDLTDFIVENCVVITLIIFNCFDLSALSMKEVVLTTLGYVKITSIFLMIVSFYTAVIYAAPQKTRELKIFFDFTLSPICVVFAVLTFNFIILTFILKIKPHLPKIMG